MISIAEALDLYIKQLSPLDHELVDTHQALHRVLAEDQYSTTDLPRFDQSAMDGYAFIAADSNPPPHCLPIVATSAAGHWSDEVLEPGTAWRIYTGARVPINADTVIPQELVSVDDNHIHLVTAYSSGKNIRYKGEEMARNTLLASRGQRLTPGLIASLRNGGIEQISVHRSPRISLIVTGDEVRSPGTALREGDIPDSNGPYAQNWLLANGYAAPDIIYVSDEQSSVENCLRQAMEKSDLVITTGGASVGDRDFIPQTATALGFEEVFWRVAQKPGKPLYFGRRHATALLGLPGNPGAVLVGMEVHARTILNCLQGAAEPRPAWLKGPLISEIPADQKRDRLIRLQLVQNDAGLCQLLPLGKQDSHMLSNLERADVLAHLPARSSDYQPGEILNFLILSQ